jgi:hypothetical protein
MGICDRLVKSQRLDVAAKLAQRVERAICEIAWLVASEHLYHITNIGLNIHSDMPCDISRKKRQNH